MRTRRIDADAELGAAVVKEAVRDGFSAPEELRLRSREAGNCHTRDPLVVLTVTDFHSGRTQRSESSAAGQSPRQLVVRIVRIGQVVRKITDRRTKGQMRSCRRGECEVKPGIGKIYGLPDEGKCIIEYGCLRGRHIPNFHRRHASQMTEFHGIQVHRNIQILGKPCQTAQRPGYHLPGDNFFHIASGLDVADLCMHPERLSCSRLRIGIAVLRNIGRTRIKILRRQGMIGKMLRLRFCHPLDNDTSSAFRTHRHLGASGRKLAHILGPLRVIAASHALHHPPIDVGIAAQVSDIDDDVRCAAGKIDGVCRFGSESDALGISAADTVRQNHELLRSQIARRDLHHSELASGHRNHRVTVRHRPVISA